MEIQKKTEIPSATEDSASKQPREHCVNASLWLSCELITVISMDMNPAGMACIALSKSLFRLSFFSEKNSTKERGQAKNGRTQKRQDKQNQSESNAEVGSG